MADQQPSPSGSKRPRQSRRVGVGASVIPIASIAIALVLVLAVLPTALRPPPDRPNEGAELSPDAPPDTSQEAIVEALRRSSSATAGAGVEGPAIGPGVSQDAAGPGGVADPVSDIRQPSRFRCFGQPPRQTDSAYSPPCQPAFVGDNGGSTYRNVTGDEVRIAYWHILGMPPANERGPIADPPPPGESAEHRTARVIQRWFNERYELYGRRVQLVAIDSDDPAAAVQRSAAIDTDVQDRAFASVHLFYEFCDETARRKLPCFNGNPYPGEVYAENDPYFWSYQMGTDETDAIAAEYVCKKLVGRPAEFAGGAEAGRPRRIGVVVESNATMARRTPDPIVEQLRRQCGYDAVFDAQVDGGDPSTLGTAISRARLADATTIIFESSLGPAIELMSSADGSAYFPEWVMFNSYGLDFNDSARLLPKTQTEHMFGMSGWELPRPFQHTDCWRAYKSIEPSSNPNANFCNVLWISLEHLVNGIQQAGPDLNPFTFRDGLYSIPYDPVGRWVIGGGFSPGHHWFVRTLAEMWWDPNATDPAGGERGAFRFPERGARRGVSQLDRETRVFRDGVTGYQER